MTTACTVREIWCQVWWFLQQIWGSRFSNRFPDQQIYWTIFGPKFQLYLFCHVHIFLSDKSCLPLLVSILTMIAIASADWHLFLMLPFATGLRTTGSPSRWPDPRSKWRVTVRDDLWSLWYCYPISCPKWVKNIALGRNTVYRSTIHHHVPIVFKG